MLTKKDDKNIFVKELEKLLVNKEKNEIIDEEEVKIIKELKYNLLISAENANLLSFGKIKLLKALNNIRFFINSAIHDYMISLYDCVNENHILLINYIVKNICSKKQFEGRKNIINVIHNIKNIVKSKLDTIIEKFEDVFFNSLLNKIFKCDFFYFEKFCFYYFVKINKIFIYVNQIFNY